MTRIRVLMIAAALVGCAAWCGAQPRNPVNDLLSGYDRGDYQRVAALAESLAADTAALSRDEVATLRTYWAFALVALGRDGEAAAQFTLLLRQRPATDLNPEFVSPKIIAVFRDAQAAFNRAAAAAGPGPRLVLKPPQPGKPGALLRTLVWPGWGQSYRGQAKRGRMFQIASLAAVAGLGAAELGAYVAHRDYLNARDSGRISDTYTTYNHWYRFRNLTVNLTVSVWVLGVVDVMMGD
ncbi:MAG TPA: hypothetical protein VMF29_03440 [Candidatus Edwardsbacteria bacterium]|nr:hypothetical protein [Candidatus Edwardsbacteria bacterium]